MHGKVYTSEERMKPTFYGAYVHEKEANTVHECL